MDLSSLFAPRIGIRVCVGLASGDGLGLSALVRTFEEAFCRSLLSLRGAVTRSRTLSCSLPRGTYHDLLAGPYAIRSIDHDLRTGRRTAVENRRLPFSKCNLYWLHLGCRLTVGIVFNHP